MRPARRTGLAVLAGCALAVAGAGAAHGQSVRIAGSTSLRYVEIRPLMRDSVAADRVEGSGLLRQTPEGRVVRCVPGESVCRGTRPADPVSTVPVIQDLEVSAWGLGEGVRLFAHLRGRTAWGGRRELWPQADDAFDLLVAYGEIDRARFRVRAGRQWQVSGLGFYNFDGLALALRPAGGLSVEGYAGRSLIRGLNGSHASGALESIEALAPEEPGVLLGVQARYRASGALGIGGFYQREVRDDRAGLYSERAGADGVLRGRAGSVEGSLELDVVTRALNEARLGVRSPPLGRAVLHADIRRHRPFFELWTIWGAFSPLGFDEARAGVTGALASGGLVVRGEGLYRRYEDAGLSGVGQFRRDGWGVSATASWAGGRAWSVDAGYRAEVALGAARNEGHAALVRSLGELGSVALRGVAFQRLYEFRLEEGTVVGLGGDASLRISERARVFGALAGYRHLGADRTPDLDWNQLRGSLRLQWTVGAEPRRALPGAVGVEG